MNRKGLIISVVAIMLLSLCSCHTTETKVEYVPTELNIEELIQPVLEMRPEQPRLIDSPESLSDIMQNSISFQFAYEDWRGYAELLESFYLSIGTNKLT